MKKVFFKISILFLTISLVFPSFLVPVYVVKANEVEESQVLSPQEKELADALQFMFDNAVVYDKNGYVKDINFDIIYDEYGYSKELARVENIIRFEKTLKADMGHCAVVAIQDTLGVAAISALISGGVVGMLQRKAAGEIAKLVAKTALKNIAPYAAAASLIWSFGRCMWF